MTATLNHRITHYSKEMVQDRSHSTLVASFFPVISAKNKITLYLIIIFPIFIQYLITPVVHTLCILPLKIVSLFYPDHKSPEKLYLHRDIETPPKRP